MKTKLVLLAALVGLLSTGCGNLKVTPKSVANGKGPLSSLPPTTVCLNVTDERPAEDRAIIGQLYSAFGGVVLKIESIPPVTDVIQETLATELQTNGHHLVTGTATPAVQMDVALKRFFYECKPHMWDVEVVVNTVAELRIARDGKNTPPIAISATHRKSRQIVGRGGHVKIINDGLAEFARVISFDPRVQEAMTEKAAAKTVASEAVTEAAK